jgi:hydrogenase-1 operon protein HyaF
MADMTDPGTNPSFANAVNGLGDAVLRELSRLLTRLATEPNFSDAIDLNSLPMGEAERDRLRDRLGVGEVRAAIDAAGPSQIVETAYSGVWWVRHGDSNGDAVLEQIVVARVPALLLAHPSGIHDAGVRLSAELSAAAVSSRARVETAETAHD